MPNNHWIKNPDETLSCLKCGASSFAPGGSDEDLPTSCNCSADDLAATLDPRKLQPAAAGQATGPSAGLTFSAGLLSVVECERRLASIGRAQRRLRAQIRDVLCEDEHIKPNPERPGIWREAWRAHHSKLSMLSKHLAEERKQAVAEYEAALRRERGDEVARKERLARALLAIRDGRTDEAETLLAEGSAN